MRSLGYMPNEVELEVIIQRLDMDGRTPAPRDGDGNGNGAPSTFPLVKHPICPVSAPLVGGCRTRRGMWDAGEPDPGSASCLEPPAHSSSPSSSSSPLRLRLGGFNNPGALVGRNCTSPGSANLPGQGCWGQILQPGPDPARWVSSCTPGHALTTQQARLAARLQHSLPPSACPCRSSTHRDLKELVNLLVSFFFPHLKAFPAALPSRRSLHYSLLVLA